MTTIRVIDFETTGMEPPAEVIEVGYCDLTKTEGGWAVGDPDSWLCGVEDNPPEARSVHHITLAETEGQPPFNAEALRADLSIVDAMAAHNSDFETKFFRPVGTVICTYKVALRLWPDAPSHGLQFLRYHLELPVNPAMAMPPHRAAPDAYVCALLMQRIMEVARDKLDDMVRWSDGPALLPRVPFGKHKGASWDDVPIDYLDWVVNKAADMDRDMKSNAKHHLKRRATE